MHIKEGESSDGMWLDLFMREVFKNDTYYWAAAWPIRKSIPVFTIL